MAQGKQQSQSTADSVFDFIFGSAKKNIRKPQKLEKAEPSGATGNEMADGLMEVAAMPATYASEQVFTPMAEILGNVKLTEEIDAGSNAGSKLTLKDASNPNAPMEKGFMKQEGAKVAARKLNMIRGIGGSIDMAVGAVTAKRMALRQGVSGAKATQIGRELGNEYMSQQKRNHKAQEKASIGAAYQTFGNSDIGDEEVENVAKVFNSALDESKLDRAAGSSARDHSRGVIRSRLDKYTDVMNLTDDQKDSLVDNYLDFEQRRNHEQGEWDLGASGLSTKDDKDRPTVGQVGDVEQVFANSKDPADKFRALKYDELKSKRLFYAQQLNRLDPNDPRYREYQRKLMQVEDEGKVLETWQTSNDERMKWSAFLGEANTTIDNLKFMTSAQGGLYAVMNGDFYDDKKNPKWNPTKEIKLPEELKNDSEEKLGIKVAKGDDADKGIVSASKSQRFMTGVHYFTPASISRTLFVNGEGFDYLAYMRRRNMKNSIKQNDRTMLDMINSSTENKEAFRSLGISVDDSSQAVQDMMDNYSKTVQELQQRISNGGISHERGKKLVGKLSKMDNKIRNSWMSRYSKKLKKFWYKINNSRYSPVYWSRRFYNYIFRGTLKWTLTMFIGRKLATKFVNRLAGGMALRTIIKAGVRKAVHAVTQALGITLGAIGNAIIFILTEIGIILSEKLFKPVSRVAMFLFFGIPLVVFFLILGPIAYFDSLNPFSPASREFDTASAAAPIHCEECEWPVEHYLHPSAQNMDYNYMIEGTGEWWWPVDRCDRMTSPYGPRWGRFHSGIDIACGRNDSIHASREGRVILSGYVGGYGYTVEIDHGDGSNSLYAHMTGHAQASVGDEVDRGERIGIMGTTGFSTGIHLHFEICEDGCATGNRIRTNPCNYDGISQNCN